MPYDYDMKDMKPMDASKADPMAIKGQQEVAMAEDDMYSSFQPRGDFSRTPLNALVMVTRKLQPMFGLKGDYPKFDSDIDELPIEFVRVLMMFKQAVDDAIAQDILDEEDRFELEQITDDSSLKILAGKLGKVMRNKKFKKMLSSKPEGEKPEQETPMEAEERSPMPMGSDQTIDALFMERM